MRVLIVEDEPNLGRQLRSTLEGAGYAVSEAGDGRQAMRRLAAQPPDLVVLDIFMPEMDGLEVLQQLREQCRSCRVMAISAADACSPVANSWSASRQAGCAVSSAVLCSRRSVVFPCAETTAIIWKPAAAASASCPAAQRSPAASATEEPPNL